MKKLCAKLFFNVFIIIVLTYGNPVSIYPQQEDGLPPNSLQKITALNFKDTDIRDVARSVAYEYQTNIVIENDINKNITVTLFNIDVKNAIRIIAEDNGLVFKYDSERFYISKPKEFVPPPKPENEPAISYANGKLSMTLDDVDILNFVKKLRYETGKNFLLTSGTTGRITGSLKNIELETGLKNILQNSGYYLIERDSIFYISRSSYYSSLNNTNNQNSNPYWVSAHNGLVTLDVTQANLDHIIDDLANQLHLQIIKLAVPEGNASVKCYEVPLNTALTYLFKGSDFSFRKDKTAYFIGKKNSQNLDNTKLVELKYLRADKLKETIPNNFLQGVNVGVSLEHNGLILNGSNEAISDIESYIDAIDKPVPQVVIEAMVVDYNLDDILQYGIRAGRGDSSQINRKDQWYPGINATASGKKINDILNELGTINIFGKDIDVAKLGHLPDDFYINIQALEQNGIANIKSRPVLSTINGHTASLKIGTVQNYVFDEVVPIVNAVNSTYIQKETIQKIEANISFEITPWVGPNDEMTLEIKPDFETPVGPFSPDKKLIPAINTRSLLSTVRLKDGETIVLGGLIQDSETSTVDKFPILGDIPIIGSLFSSTDKKNSKSELMIYLTPKIYYGDDFGSLYFEYGKTNL